ncbi:dUTP diphosphatase [bacterium]|nr:dUTP diphosphatase [bacterium]
MKQSLEVKCKILREGASIPKFMSDGSAGADLFACLPQPIFIEPGKWETIPIGISLAIPHGFEGEVRPRSGLARNFGITLLNAPGTIDSDYRGELMVILINHGEISFRVEDGDRIAQLLIKPVLHATFIRTDTLEESSRGDGGFGSTGIRG